MLKLKKSQLDALSEAAWQRYCVQLMDFFRKSSPQAFSGLDDEKLLIMISNAVKKARAHGVTTTGGITRFVGISLLVDPDFDSHAEVRNYLASAGDPELKMYLLSEQLLRQMRKHPGTSHIPPLQA